MELGIHEKLVYTAEVMIRDFSVPVRFYFKNVDERKIFTKLVKDITHVRPLRGRPLVGTDYDLDATRCNVAYYFGQLIEELTYTV